MGIKLELGSLLDNLNDSFHTMMAAGINFAEVLFRSIEESRPHSVQD